MDRIKLNVGGELFETYKTTLEGIEFFTVLLNSCSEDKEDRSNPEPIFIDRSGYVFRHVISWLRDPKYPYPEEYLSELEFYGIEQKPRVIVQKHDQDWLRHAVQMKQSLQTIIQNQREMINLLSRHPPLRSPPLRPRPDQPFYPPFVRYSSNNHDSNVYHEPNVLDSTDSRNRPYHDPLNGYGDSF